MKSLLSVTSTSPRPSEIAVAGTCGPPDWNRMLGPDRCPVSAISDSSGEVGEPEATQAACDPAGPGTSGPPSESTPVSGRA